MTGDTCGYQLGRRFGPTVPWIRPSEEASGRSWQAAQDFLRRRGGSAVFLGRFVAFFRAVMPALAGISRMHYPRFLAFNAAGGLVWGAGCVLLGFFAGNSYEAVAKAAGRDITAGVLLAALAAVVIWRIRKARGNPGREPGRATAGRCGGSAFSRIRNGQDLRERHGWPRNLRERPAASGP